MNKQIRLASGGITSLSFSTHFIRDKDCVGKRQNYQVDYFVEKKPGLDFSNKT